MVLTFVLHPPDGAADPLRACSVGRITTWNESSWPCYSSSLSGNLPTIVCRHFSRLKTPPRDWDLLGLGSSTPVPGDTAISWFCRHFSWWQWIAFFRRCRNVFEWNGWCLIRGDRCRIFNDQVAIFIGVVILLLAARDFDEVNVRSTCFEDNEFWILEFFQSIVKIGLFAWNKIDGTCDVIQHVVKFARKSIPQLLSSLSSFCSAFPWIGWTVPLEGRHLHPYDFYSGERTHSIPCATWHCAVLAHKKHDAVAVCPSLAAACLAAVCRASHGQKESQADTIDWSGSCRSRIKWKCRRETRESPEAERTRDVAVVALEKLWEVSECIS